MTIFNIHKSNILGYMTSFSFITETFHIKFAENSVSSYYYCLNIVFWTQAMQQQMVIRLSLDCNSFDTVSDQSCASLSLCSATAQLITWSRGPLVFQAGYHPRKRTLKTHPKHVFFRYENRPYIRVFACIFLICVSCPFQNLSIWPKTHPFFQFCTFLHP